LELEPICFDLISGDISFHQRARGRTTATMREACIMFLSPGRRPLGQGLPSLGEDFLAVLDRASVEVKLPVSELRISPAGFDETLGLSVESLTFQEMTRGAGLVMLTLPGFVLLTGAWLPLAGIRLGTVPRSLQKFRCSSLVL
jgi:hypothetical protein